MPRQIFNIFIFITCLSALLLAPWSTSNALSPDYAAACSGNYWTTDVSPMAIICPLARLVNILVYSSGAFLLVFIFIGAIKYALAQGDPKGLQAAQQTLTMAIGGFIIIIGVFALFTIIKNVLGLGGVIEDPWWTLSSNLFGLLRKFNIE